MLNKLEDLNKFFENRQYVAGDYLTYADFTLNEKLTYVNAFALKAIKVNSFYLFINILR